MELDASTQRLTKILGQMASASRDALRAGAAGDEIQTRSAVDRIRSLQAKLATLDANQRSAIDKLPIAQREAIQTDINQIHQAQAFVRTWSKRYQVLADLATLSLTSEGRHAVLDYTLPNDWNFEGDVFLLFDENELGFWPELVQRGQNRILYVGKSPAPQEAKNAGLFSTHEAGEIRAYFMQLRNPAPLRLSFLKSENPQTREPIWSAVRHAFTLCHSNFQTSKTLGDAWMKQGLKNLDAIARSANLAVLKKEMQGLPIVIVSPGPSLDKNIHLLKDLKGRAILMAAAQCARALHTAGVVPDFIVVADPGKLTYFLDGVDTSDVDALIVGVSSHPDFYNKLFRNTISFNANSAVDAWISDIFGDTLPISAAGSVSIDCFFFAKYWGCSQIIMVGLDLALSQGRSYSNQSANSESLIAIDENSGTLKFSNISENMREILRAQGKSQQDDTETLMTLPGYFGGTVFTRPNYHLFHGEFEVLARYEQGLPAPTPLINCTEGGAYIEGFEHISLCSAIEKYIGKEDKRITARIQSACSTVDKKQRLIQARNAKLDILKNIRKTRRLVKECQSLSQPGNNTSAKLNTLRIKEQELIQSIRRTPFISLPNVDLVKKAMEMAGDTSNINETNMVARYIYESVEHTCKEVQEIIESSDLG